MRLFNTALLNKAVLRTSYCVLALGIPGSILAQDAPSVNPATVGIQAGTQNDTPVSALPADTIASSELPDSPGTAWSKAQQDAPRQTSSSPSTSGSPAQAPSSETTAAPHSTDPNQTHPNQTDPNQTDPNQNDPNQNEKPQRPVGTAAAEAPRVNGVTAAQPAGVAIAPAKQRRVRTIVLRVGALVGAGAALGTVIALTAATPSKPPGAH
jgi:hypothetical protein